MKVISILSLCILVSCNGGGSGSESSAPSKVSKTINDTSLVHFQQISGIAKNKQNIFDYIVSKAYAATGNISCYSGEDVSFDMDIKVGSLTENLQVNAKCGEDIELKVRQGMVKVLSGNAMTREKSAGNTGYGYWLDFTVDGFQYGKPYLVREKIGWAGIVIDPSIHTCYIDYTFNEAEGTVTADTFAPSYPSAHYLNSEVNDHNGITNPHRPSASNNYIGCNSTGIKMVLGDFRFKNGKIEIDESGKKLFSPTGCALYKDDGTNTVLDYKENGINGVCPDIGYQTTYERFCVSNNSPGVCDQ